MICLNRRTNHMSLNTIRADQRAIYVRRRAIPMRRRVIHMSRKRLFPKRIRGGWTPPGVARAGGNDKSGTRQRLPVLQICCRVSLGGGRVLRKPVQFGAVRGRIWANPVQLLAKRVPVWAKRCQFLRKPVRVWRGVGRICRKLVPGRPKQVPFHGKSVPGLVEAETFGANASPFSENRYRFLE
jgi:hypothetical protein